jgi:hypothetical protein
MRLCVMLVFTPSQSMRNMGRGGTRFVPNTRSNELENWGFGKTCNSIKSYPGEPALGSSRHDRDDRKNSSVHESFRDRSFRLFVTGICDCGELPSVMEVTSIVKA